MVALPAVLATGYSLVVHATVLYVAQANPEIVATPWGNRTSLLVIASASIAAAVACVVVRRRAPLRLCLALHSLAVIALVVVLAAEPIAALLIATTPVLMIALFEPFPTSLAWSGVYSAGVLVACVSTRMTGDTQLSASDALAAIAPATVTALIGVTAAWCIGYRERLVALQEDHRRLDQALDQITRTNQEYQDNLIRVEAESTESERQRITRDIHDVVGYTLTNNIMLMEAATDLARNKPLGVTRLLSLARENAEEGLKRVRETLYGLRRRDDSVPHGIAAIVKLIKTFEAATGITVRASFTNTPVHLAGGTEYAIYHLVQESMTNSFRHGHASAIDVITSIDGEFVQVVIQDNGIGATEVIEGIGLKGMNERIDRIGGTVTYRADEHGFTVIAMIPRRMGP